MCGLCTQLRYFCVVVDAPLPFEYAQGCADSVGAAKVECRSAFGDPVTGPINQNYNEWDFHTIACGGSAGHDCSSWEPGGAVLLNSDSVYEVDFDFVAALVDDPTTMWSCDEARFEQTADGFRLTGVAEGDLVAELGLRNGDIPTSLNGYPLETFQEVIDAFIALWHQHETSFTLELERPQVGPAVIHYELEP